MRWIFFLEESVNEPAADDAAGGEKSEVKIRMRLTFEEYKRLSNMLVIRLRQEETRQAGTSAMANHSISI